MQHWGYFKKECPPDDSTILVYDVRSGEIIRAKVTGPRQFTTEHCKVYSFDHSFYSHWRRIDLMMPPLALEIIDWKAEQNIP